MSRILIVDDEPAIVELLEEHLQSEGYETEHAFSGEEALARLEKSAPDLVILDLMLPGMDGYEVCRLMQADARLNHVPVIMLTARTSVPNKVLGYQRGADDYMVKPFDPDELSVRVRAQLHHLYHDAVSELTGLPGTELVERKIDELRSSSGQAWAIIYIDIMNFTAYNESYSFIEGDDMINMAAHALRQAIEAEGKETDFVGHLGGDQFVIITRPERIEKIKEAATRIFQEGTRDFYSPTDRDQGYILIVNHQGLLSQMELCALSFDVVSSEDNVA
ncbi:MAG: response regulator [Chloroflexota bacterium]